MISIQNKKMIIPEEERFIGHLGDHLAQKREFFISGDYDNGAVFRLYLKFKSGAENYFVLEPSVPSAGTTLCWRIQREHIFEDGIVQAQLKVFDGQGEIWHSTIDYFLVKESLEITEPPQIPTEFEEIEQKLNEKLTQINKAALKSPVIGANGNWWFYDQGSKTYLDSGYSSKGEKGDQGELGDQSVVTRHISNQAVTAEKIADHCIDSDKLANQGILNQNLGYFCVSADKIEPGSVIEKKLAQNSVTEEKIAAGAVTREKLSEDSTAYIEERIQADKYCLPLSLEKSLEVVPENGACKYKLTAYNDDSIAVLNQAGGEVFSFDSDGIRQLDSVSKSVLTKKASGNLIFLEQGVKNTNLRSGVINGLSSIQAGQSGEEYALCPSQPSFITETGTNILKTADGSFTNGGLTCSCQNGIISIDGTSTGSDFSSLDRIVRYDAPFTLHIQVLSGSSTGSGMYFTPDTLLAFQTQTKYFANGIEPWNGHPRRIATGTAFSGGFTCRIWATPGDTPNEPYQTYAETMFPLPEGLSLYSTPSAECCDSFDILTGIRTSRCGIYSLKTGWIYGYSAASENIIWITNDLFLSNKKYYFVRNGTVTGTNLTDWQGKIQISLPKSAAGITSSDTGAQASAKMFAYWGDAYAVVPLKKQVIEQFKGLPKIPLLNGRCTLCADSGELDVEYCRELNGAYDDIIQYTKTLESRIAQLEKKG